MNVTGGDFRLSMALNASPVSTPAFAGGDRPASAFPVGELANGILADRAGNSRTTNNSVGAYAFGATSTIPATPPSPTPTSPTQPTTPSLPAPVEEPGQRPEPLPTPDPVVAGDVAVALYATPYPTVVQGSNISYRVTVSNRGAGPIDLATIDVSLPSTVQFISARTPQGSCAPERSGGVVHCRLGSIAAGRSVILTLVYKPIRADSLEISVLAYNLEGEDLDEENVLASNTITVLAPQANLASSLTNVNQTCRGTGAAQRCTISGRITISNSGTKASGAMRTNVLYVPSSSGGERLLRGLNVPAIAAGHTRVYTISRTLARRQRGAFVSVQVDVNRQVSEANENDNRVEMKLP